ncbi:MAG: hypothetical protein CMN34_04150 [Saprospirales bacterium]|nr:hypothetical protein [Saprospirales bacterium]
MTENDVYGISSALPDYQIAFHLNCIWHCEVLRLKDEHPGELNSIPYTIFGQFDFQAQRGIYLLTNKRHRQFLLDFAKPFDFVLYFQFQDPTLIKTCVNQLKTTDNIAMIKGIGEVSQYPLLQNIIAKTNHENNPYNKG